ncbi:MAG: nucleotidyltransferase domain-containing protein [Candidatus Bathyarchaeia archaeon]
MTLTTAPKNWLPMDGDTFTTREGFILNVFGYEHPEKRVLTFLKYIPSKFKELFNIRLLGRTWRYGRIELFRAEKLYTAKNYKTFLEVFRTHFPDYVYHCPYRGKDVISVPLKKIRRIYVPRECLQRLLKMKKLDKLQRMTLDFVNLVSSASEVALDDFGVHGSVALNMHSQKSDIDIVVYGSQNFRKVEEAINKLVEEGTLSYVFNNRLDAARRFKGRYREKIFMYNAIRKPEEVTTKYGEYFYTPIALVKFQCRVKDDSEAMFRPAIYKIEDYTPLNKKSKLPREMVPWAVVSMIGCYRNIARSNQKIEVSGMLERVKRVGGGEAFYQVVVGTAESEEEYIWPA